jgi:LysM repeat protein
MKLELSSIEVSTGVLEVISEREKLEFESLPEFIREPYSAGREAYVPPTASKGSRADDRFASIDEKFGHQYDGRYAPVQDKFPDLDSNIDEIVRPKHEALDTLWPGVEREFLQPRRRSPSFYLTIGFMAGSFVSLLGVFGYSLISHAVVTSGAADGGKKIVVAGSLPVSPKSQAAEGSAHTTVVNGAEVLIPAFTTYEVKTGDTLAGIALKAYRRVSPRMLDEICRANNMRSANVLSLGQKLTLPEYHPQSSNLATGAATPSM